MERVCIITGGSSGIGEAMARRFLEGGDRVVIGDLQPPSLSGPDFVAVDLAGSDDCRRLVETVVRRHGGIDVLVNNAGFQHVEALESFPEEVWDRMLAVMLTAPFRLIQGAWPHLKKRGSGRIVNMGSIHSLVASPFKSGYVSAKHGLLGLTRAAALEGAEHGITVNAVCPAYVRTPLVESQIADQARHLGLEKDEVVEQVMLGPAPLKRLIEPEEVAELVHFLCSPAAGSMTGAVLTLDLGWTAR